MFRISKKGVGEGEEEKVDLGASDSPVLNWRMELEHNTTQYYTNLYETE